MIIIIKWVKKIVEFINYFEKERINISGECMKKCIETTFLAKAVTNRNNPLVMIPVAKNERDRKQTSPFAKLGFISGTTLRGWLRHAIEKLLLEHEVSVCHNIPDDSVTAARNKIYYKEDHTLGYHSWGSCNPNGGCLIYQLFGFRDVPGNLLVPSILYYPTTTGNGSATTNINKAFGGIGQGRVDGVRNSPRARKNSHQTYLSIEYLAGIAIEAPFKLILHEANEDHETLIRMGLHYLNEMIQADEFDFLLGGMRNQGFGKATALPMVEKKKRKSSKSQILGAEENAPSGGKSPRMEIEFKTDKTRFKILETKFQALITKEKMRGFAIKKEAVQHGDNKIELSEAPN